MWEGFEMATTSYREDFLGRDLQAPTVNALDYLGRPCTSTTDSTGRPLRRILRANSTAYTTGTEIQFAGGEKFLFTVGGTSAATPPTPPAVGATVADGGATLLRQK
jgi:hypothetical protein